jgi:hypothetical protein
MPIPNHTLIIPDNMAGKRISGGIQNPSPAGSDFPFDAWRGQVKK